MLEGFIVLLLILRFSLFSCLTTTSCEFFPFFCPTWEHPFPIEVLVIPVVVITFFANLSFHTMRGIVPSHLLSLFFLFFASPPFLISYLVPTLPLFCLLSGAFFLFVSRCFLRYFFVLFCLFIFFSKCILLHSCLLFICP